MKKIIKIIKHKRIVINILLTIFLIIIGSIIIKQPTKMVFSVETKSKAELKNLKYHFCLNDKNSFKEDNFSKELINSKEAIIDKFTKNKEAVSFKYEDLVTNYTFGYKEEREYYAASVTKLAVALYIYQLSDEEKIDLKKELTYTNNFKAGGAGILKNSKYGSKYTIKQLLEYAIQYSDNSAYFMLLSEINIKELETYWKEKGVNLNISGEKFGNLTANIGNIYIKELYDYYLSNKTNGQKLISDMNVSRNLEVINNKELEIAIAHKYGNYNEYYHDISLVQDNKPYSLSILSLKGNSKDKDTFFQNVHLAINNFHENYWQEKHDYCYNYSTLEE